MKELQLDKLTPLVTYEPIERRLNEILEQYPPNTILSEQLQNSDDAGSTKLIFQLDTKSYGAGDLFQSKLYPNRSANSLQGPSLIIYNDSLFSDSDWKGVSQIGRGSKKFDLNKVGKFGIGFNSVYHVTDSPMILSGSKCYFPDIFKNFPSALDSNEEPGIIFGIQSPLSDFQDQFEPFIKFGMKPGMDAFPGTIFRLPLRLVESKLNLPCSVETIQELFQVFIKQSSHLLLFLKNIKELKIMIDDRVLLDVTIQHQDKRTEIARHIKQFSLVAEQGANGKKKQALQKFKELLVSQSQDSNPITSYPLHIKIKNEKEEYSYHWMITQGIVVTPQLSEILNSERMKKTKLIPTGGIATLVSTTDPTQEFKGRPFCFLPVGELVTSLPFHFNGYFILADSRREINLVDIKDTTHPEYYKNNWNRCMISQVVATLYLKNLEYIQDQYFNVYKEKRSEFYRFLPNTIQPAASYHQQIEDIIKQSTITEIVTKRKFFYNHFDPVNAEWTNLNQLCLLNGEKDFIKTILQERNIPSIEISPSFIKYLEKPTVGLNQHVSYLRKEYICQVLRKDPLTKFNSQVFEYLVKDITNNMIAKGELKGVKLIPMMDGSLLEIGNATDIGYFTDPDKHKAYYQNLILKPSSSNLLIDITLLQPIEQSTIVELTKYYSNVNQFELDSFFGLFKEKFGKSLREESHSLDQFQKNNNIEIQWLWEYIGSELNSDFKTHGKIQSLLYDFPVVPTTDKCLVEINHPRLVNEVTESSLLPVIPLLAKCNYKNIPDTHRSNIFKTESSCKTVLTSITNEDIRNHLDNNERDQLLKFFLNSCYLDAYGKQSGAYTLLAKLEIFKVFPNQQHKEHSTIIANQTICSQDPLVREFSKLIPNELIVDLTGFNDSTMAYLPANTKIMTFEQINVTYILPNINRFPSILQLRAIDHILEGINNTYSPYLESLKYIEWVPTQDPNVFGAPHSLYLSTDQTAILKYCGAAGKRKLISEPLSIENNQSSWHRFGVSSKIPISIVKEILSLLKTYPVEKSNEMYQEIVQFFIDHHKLYTDDEIVELKSIEWVRTLNQHTYVPYLHFIQPANNHQQQSIPQLTECKYLKPTDCFKREHIDICFTTSYIADQDNFPPRLSKLLFDKPSTTVIIQHLLNIVNHSHTKPSVLAKLSNNVVQLSSVQINDIVLGIYQQLHNRVDVDREIIEVSLKDESWIWSGSTFVRASQVSLYGNGKLTAMNFEPHLYVVPSQFVSKFTSLFNLFNIPNQFDISRYYLVYEIIVQEYTTINQENNQNNNNNNQKKMDDETLVKFISLVEMILSDKTPSSLEQYKITHLPSDECILYPIQKLLCTLDSQESFPIEIFKNGYRLVHLHIPSFIIKDLRVLSVQLFLNQGNGEFGQSEDLVNKIKNLLPIYGIKTLMKEMIQNAEDANATEFSVCLDKRDFSPAQKNNDQAKEYYNQFLPSLIFYNNSTFSQVDIQNVQSLGNSIKKESRSSIGRFGLGFNSVYNATDIPSFVSNNEVFIFDPKKTHFMYNNTTRPGRRFEFTFKDYLKELFIPYQNYKFFGLDLDQPQFNGTLFRLPLRAATDLTSISTFEYGGASKLMNEFVSQLEECMLFLSTLSQCSIYIWDEGEKEPTLLHRVTRQRDASKETLKSKLNHINRLQVNQAATHLIQTTKFWEKALFTITDAYGGEKKKEWILGHMIGGVKSSKLYLSVMRSNNPLKTGGYNRVPFGSVAICLTEPITNGGKVFTFLPLNIYTSLPVHINGQFDLHSGRDSLVDDRHYSSTWDFDLTLDDLMIGGEGISTKWNVILLEDIISEIYIDTLIELRSEQCLTIEDVDGYFDFFPINPACPQPYERIYRQFYHLFLSRKMLPNYPLSKSGRIQWYHLTKDYFVFKSEADLDIMSVLAMDKPILYAGIVKKMLATYKITYTSITQQEVYSYYTNLCKKLVSFTFDKAPVKSLSTKENIITIHNFVIDKIKNHVRESLYLPYILNEQTIQIIGNSVSEFYYYDKEVMEGNLSEFVPANSVICRELSELYRANHIRPYENIKGDGLSMLTITFRSILPKITQGKMRYADIIKTIDYLIDNIGSLDGQQYNTLMNTKMVPFSESNMKLETIHNLYNQSSDEIKPFVGLIPTIPETLKPSTIEYIASHGSKSYLTNEHIVLCCKEVSDSYKSLSKSNKPQDSKLNLLFERGTILSSLFARKLSDDKLYQLIQSYNFVPCIVCDRPNSFSTKRTLSTLVGSFNPGSIDKLFAVAPIREVNISVGKFKNASVKAQPIYVKEFLAAKNDHMYRQLKLLLSQPKKWDSDMKNYSKYLETSINTLAPKSILKDNQVKELSSFKFYHPVAQKYLYANEMLASRKECNFEPHFYNCHSEWNLELMERLGSAKLTANTIVEKLNSLPRGIVKVGLDQILNMFEYLNNPSHQSQLKNLSVLLTFDNRIERSSIVFKINPNLNINLEEFSANDKMSFCHPKLMEMSHISIKEFESELVSVIDTTRSIITKGESSFDKLKTLLQSEIFQTNLTKIVMGTGIGTRKQLDVLKSLKIVVGDLYAKTMVYLPKGKLELIGMGDKPRYIYDSENKTLYLSQENSEETQMAIYIDVLGKHIKLNGLVFSLFYNPNSIDTILSQYNVPLN